MYKERWKIDGLPWDQFDPGMLSPDTLRLIKAAAMVEFGADRYEKYLRNVFAKDPIFQRAAKYWAAEEIQHGETLGRYAELADRDFSFKRAYARFTSGYNFNTEVTASVRGSCSGELIARCMVEIGTSSFYTALGEGTQEPLLKVICHNIASDEFHHYSMFYSHLRGYLKHEKIRLPQRLKIAWNRIRETEDDELAYAYFTANASPNAVYDRQSSTRAYRMRMFSMYSKQNVKRMVAMLFKACGVPSFKLLHNIAVYWLWSVEPGFGSKS